MKQSAMSPTKLRSDLYNILDEVVLNNDQVTITLKSGKNVVILSEEAYNLLRNSEKERDYWKDLHRLEDELYQAHLEIEAGTTIPAKDLDWSGIMVAEESPEL